MSPGTIFKVIPSLAVPFPSNGFNAVPSVVGNSHIYIYIHALGVKNPLTNFSLSTIQLGAVFGLRSPPVLLQTIWWSLGAGWTTPQAKYMKTCWLQWLLSQCNGDEHHQPQTSQRVLTSRYIYIYIANSFKSGGDLEKRMVGCWTDQSHLPTGVLRNRPLSGVTAQMTYTSCHLLSFCFCYPLLTHPTPPNNCHD